LKINLGGLRDEIEGAAFRSTGVRYVAVAEHDFSGTDSYDLYAFSSEGDRPL